MTRGSFGVKSSRACKALLESLHMTVDDGAPIEEHMSSAQWMAQSSAVNTDEYGCNALVISADDVNAAQPVVLRILEPSVYINSAGQCSCRCCRATVRLNIGV